MRSADWTVIVPVKRLSAGKSRLRAAGPISDELVLAIAVDTIEAVLAADAVRLVIVVSDDPAVVSAARALGAVTLTDPGAGLNGAIRHGAAHVGDGQPRAALLADLPALRSPELAAALGRVETPGRGFVRDHLGTGTTLLAALPTVPLDPHFGPGSAAAHTASGAVSLDGDWPTLRQDVDTPADLAAAVAMGVGRRTAARVLRS